MGELGMYVQTLVVCVEVVGIQYEAPLFTLKEKI